MNQHQKAFLKLMEDASRNEGYRPFEAFSAFLEMGFRALVSVTLTPDDRAKSEAEYEKRVASFRHRTETATIYAKALAIVVEGLEAEPCDFLGPIFMECAANPHTGQFFTPWCLCQMMAQMTIDESVAEISRQRVVTVQEPASGCGGMVLAAAERMKELGVNPATRAHFVLVDVDQRCAWASYIQCTLMGISATVIHGNTLSLETWGQWDTVMARAFPKRIAEPIAEIPTIKSEPPAQRVSQPAAAPLQLALL